MGIFGKEPDGKPAPGAPPTQRPAPPNAPPLPHAARGAGSACVVGAKTTFKGEITGDEDVLVEGAVEGLVRISRDLRVAASGSVRANVEANSVIVSGEVVGDCTAAVRVDIQATGRLTGNIRAPKIVIAEGAVFRGNSDMSPRQGETPPRQGEARPIKTTPPHEDRKVVLP
jgi:cytoskeletal protein CcmA (bactofilin family)